MKYESINPATWQVLKTFDFSPFPDLTVSKKALRYWSKLSVAQRNEQLQKFAALLKNNKDALAQLITLEMGKLLRESEHEIEKTLTLFEYYATHAEKFLQPVYVPTNARESYYHFEPLGIIFCIMPWNFPFWQVLRFAVPALYAGNVIILKHAPSVPQCALMLEQLFSEAGFPEGVFSSYFLSNDDAAQLIAHPDIAAISFTGSDTTGSLLAELAGRHVKKMVMELGGNDAFIVLKDADIDAAVLAAVKSRTINAGQACNGAKRFIVVREVAYEFTKKLIQCVKSLKVGNPLEADTQIAPLARKDLQQKVLKQIEKSISQGAMAHVSPQSLPPVGNYILPTVLTHVKPGVTAFEEEIFGPVFSVIEAEDEAHAIQLANLSQYGLAASIWTNNIAHAKTLIAELQTGNVFINDIVKSDVRLPFGGIKRSGFGRELSEAGLKEFVNIKTVFIK